MRMKELVEVTGVPRTAIHHYQREGLLPPAVKTAPNAALYDSSHVERLNLIRSLRSDELGPLPLDGVRRVLDMVDEGVEPGVAVTLYTLPGGLGKQDSPGGRHGRLSLSQLAQDVGMSLSATRSLHESGLLPGRPGAGGVPEFDEADLAAARVIADILAEDVVRPADLVPIAELVAELVRYERVLASLITANREGGEAPERPLSPFPGLHALHTYLFSRLLPEPAET